MTFKCKILDIYFTKTNKLNAKVQVGKRKFILKNLIPQSIQDIKEK